MMDWGLDSYYYEEPQPGRGQQQEEEPAFDINNFYEFLPDGFDGW
jgi:hypothetical protein